MKPHIWFEKGYWRCADRRKPLDNFVSKGASPICAQDIYVYWIHE